MIRIEADQMIDGVGEDPRRPGRLVVEGERIAGIGGSLPPPAAGQLRGSTRSPDVTLSLPGCTLLPGLIDFHSHVGIDTRWGDLGAQVQVPPAESLAAGIARIQEDLRAGVTTLRLCGDRHGVDLVLRREAEDGRIVAPRLRAAGRAIRSPRSRGGAVASVFTDDPAEIARAAASNIAEGVDFVKLFVSDGAGDPAVEPTTCYYGEAEVAAAVRPAHAAGRPVAAHLVGGAGVAAALGGGLDVIEHGWFLTEDDLDLIGRHDVLLTLTLGVLCGPHGHAFGTDPAELARLRALGEAACATARRVIARGLRYVLGTDAVHGCLADELAWVVSLGESPIRAIRAATVWPATALGLGETLGVLAPGKVADVIGVEGDPLSEIGAMARVRLVLSRGRVVYMHQRGERQ
ncbi:MAG TPA: amidohydrolase family protein [bacterium]|nr:amidohydrolase family protein [bacterium]